jgi:hypothetical protein
MPSIYDGYQGATIMDDNLGLMHWNAVEQLYEKRNVTNAEGRMYNNLDGSDGGFWLPKNWFNDKYNLKTGTFSGSIWPALAGLAVIALILYLIFRKK